MKKTHLVLFILLFFAGILLFVLSLVSGSVKIPIQEALQTLYSGNTSSDWYLTLFEFRLPKALVATLAGAALAVSGLLMQTVFRNPLAGPYILGISSGAGLGVAILVLGFPGLISIGVGLATSQWAIVIAAWIGAALILLLVMMISVRVKDIMTILIFGIMFGSAATAIVSILQYLGGESSVKAFVVWTMGSLGGVTKNQIPIFIVGSLSGLAIAALLPKNLNVLLLGENYARTMGVNIMLTRFLVFLSASLLAGTVTAFCGPIGFIGIAIPHIARMLFKTANHFILIPASLIIGADILLLSDLISQLPGKAAVLPINSITALVGIPIVIWIVIRKQKFSNFM